MTAAPEYDASIDPFAGMATIAHSEIEPPQVDAVYVAQPTDQPPTHRVKIATTCKRGKATFWAWECICGASSALHSSPGLANEAYRAHKS